MKKVPFKPSAEADMLAPKRRIESNPTLADKVKFFIM